MSPAAPSATGTTATSFVRCDEQLRDVVSISGAGDHVVPKKAPSTTGTHITYHLLMVPCYHTAYDTVSTDHT